MEFLPISHLIANTGTIKERLTPPCSVFDEFSISGKSMVELVNFVHVLTLFGKNEDKYDFQDVNHLRSKLAAYTLYSLSTYNLEQAIMLMRAMNCLRMRETRSFSYFFD